MGNTASGARLPASCGIYADGYSMQTDRHAESPDEPLCSALAMQIDAATQGFDWDDPAGLWDKLGEEIAELREARDPAGRIEELGDLLFMVVNLARHFGVDPGTALRQANAKFQRR